MPRPEARSRMVTGRHSIWLGLSALAAAWCLVAGVPIWLSVAALTCAILPAGVGMFVRGSMQIDSAAEIETALWIAAATVGAASTGGAGSPLVILYAAAIGLAWSAGQPRLALEAGVFSILGYIFAAVASVGGGWVGEGDASILSAAYGLSALVMLAVMAGIALHAAPRLAAASLVSDAEEEAARALRNAELRARRAESRANEAAAAAEAAGQALEARTRFFAQTSHELRTPLNAIIGFAEMMKHAVFGPLPTKYEEYAELIHEGGRSLSLVVDDVLDLARIEAGRYEIYPLPISLTDHAAEAVRFMGDVAKRKSIVLELECEDDIEAFADAKAVGQIALNLISNALKFTPEGGRVTVTAAASAGGALLAVSDTGVGIGAEELTRLSRAFEQGEEGRRHKGTGLGLSVVRAFAELHGGRLDIESREGGGSTIAVFFPSEPADVPVGG